MTEWKFERCIKHIQLGNKNGLREIYDDYITFIYSIILSIIRNKQDAEDVTSEFFIRLWNMADDYRPSHKHKAWLAAIAHNMSIDFLRKYHREILIGDIPESSDISKESLESQVVEKLSFEEALAALGEKEEQIINFKILGQLTFKEIANIMQMPLGTVTWKYQSGIEKLRRSGYGT